MENEILKKINNETKIINIMKIVFSIVACIFFSIMVINSIKHFSYKEVEATLISHSEVKSSVDDYRKCTGTLEYYVNGIKYEATYSLNSYDCRNGYTKKIYYDSNNPKISSDNKSIFMLVFFFAFDALSVAALIGCIKAFLKDSKDIEKYVVSQHSTSEDIKFIELDSDIYGKYKLEYNPNDIENSGDRKILELEMLEPKSESLLDISKVTLSKDILNSIFDTNKMNNVLEAYYKIELNNYKKIMEKLINQEIKTLSNWCEVPISDDGKKMLINNGTMISTELEIDNSFNIKKIYWTYSYNNTTSVSLSFSYDIKTEQIETLDVCS